ncbi:hypothetical protein CBS101457_004462 [Exobasidium rhododendri]|nr:hypothetical protein CBS101457_004462 [Exobasidium rhododendri]
MDRSGNIGVARKPSRKRAVVANKAVTIQKKHQSMGPHSQLFRVISPPFASTSSPEAETRQQQPFCQDQLLGAGLKRQKTKSKDMHTTHSPLSMPVSPSDISTSFDSSTFRSLQDTTTSDHTTASHERVERRLARMSTPVDEGTSNSVDLSRSLTNTLQCTLGQDISMYLNVEEISELGESMAAATSERVESSDCFRICIQAGPTKEEMCNE